MDYEQIIITLLYSVVTLLVIPLITILAKALISKLNSKVNDKKVQDTIVGISQIIVDSTKNVALAYVNSLKTQGKFDKKAQLEALEKIKKIILYDLSEEMKEFIETEYGSLEDWIEEQVISLAKSLNMF